MVGALISTSKLAGGAELEADVAAAGAGVAVAADEDSVCTVAGTGLPRRFPVPEKGPGGGGTHSSSKRFATLSSTGCLGRIFKTSGGASLLLLRNKSITFTSKSCFKILTRVEVLRAALRFQDCHKIAENRFRS